MLSAVWVANFLVGRGGRMVHLQRVGEKTSELQADSLIFLCQFILDVYDKAILAIVREKTRDTPSIFDTSPIPSLNVLGAG